MRDTKSRESRALAFGASAFQAFLTSLKS
ncbi:DUF397 domain-containing protein [Saccharothrix tamanrassetensis]